MDYEKAFEKARAAYGTGAYDDATLEFLFPQLRESEDERIKKIITDSVFYQYGAGVEYKDVLDYLDNLEKQKENPKNADSISADCVSDAKCEDRWHKVGDSLPDNPREVLCKDEAGNYFIGRYYVGEGWEISNYDDEDKPHHLNPPVSKWIDFPSEKQKELDKMIVVSPEVWDNAITDAYENGKKDGEKQKEQKPAEWSEEDKDMLNSCISSIEEAKENRYAYKETDGDTSYDHEIAWLKSLRPSWKPSGEQMMALRRAVNKLSNSDVADSVRLSIMHDNLKKLM